MASSDLAAVSSPAALVRSAGSWPLTTRPPSGAYCCKKVSVVVIRLATAPKSAGGIAPLSGTMTQDAWSTPNPPGAPGAPDPNAPGATTMGPPAVKQPTALAPQVQMASRFQ